MAALHNKGEGTKRLQRRVAAFANVALALLLLGGCASPGRDIGLEPGDFALLEVELRDCTSNSQHLGLETFLRNFSGTVPQIDLDHQVARIRLISPVLIDFGRLAEGFRRANTGLGDIRLTTKSTVTPDSVLLVPTGQTFPFAHDGREDPESKLRRLWFRSLQRETYPRAELEP